MTVTTTLTRTVLLANGIATSFPFNFPVASQSDLQVTLFSNTGGAPMPQLVGDQFSITMSGVGGTVVFNTPPPSGRSVVIERVTPVQQPKDFRNQGKFYPESHERGFDRGILVAQELREALGRKIGFDYDPNGGLDADSVTIPADRADRVLGFDGGGDLELRTVAQGDARSLALQTEVDGIRDLVTIDPSTIIDRVPTIAAMLAIPAPADGATTEVTEAWRSGLFEFVASATGAADGGVTFKADDATPGSWVRRFAGPMSAGWFGAVGDGVTDSTAALQAAINATGPLYVPAGSYYISAPLVIARGKRIEMVGLVSLLDRTHIFDHAGNYTRIFTDQNIDMLVIGAPHVWVIGGVIDVSPAPVYDKSAIRYDLNYPEPGGTGRAGRMWGGGVETFILGEENQLKVLGGGGKALHIDAANGPVNSYVVAHHWKIIVRNMAWGFYASQEADASQFFNSSTLDMELDGFKYGVENHCFDGTRYRLLMQTRRCVPTGETGFGFYSTVAHQDIDDWLPWDFNGNSDGLGNFAPSVFIKPGSAFVRWSQHGRRMVVEDELEVPPQGVARVYGTKGFLPSVGYLPTRNGVVISDLLNLFGLAKKAAGAITVAAYQGTGVVFETLLTDSATAGITPSADVTLSHTANFFDPTQSFPPQWTFNATALARDDYVELVVDSFYVSSVQYLFVMFYGASNGPKKLQYLGYQHPANTVVTNNRIIETGIQPDGLYSVDQGLHASSYSGGPHRFPSLASADQGKHIFRFIGSVGSNPIHITDISGYGNVNSLTARPYFHRAFGGPVYADLQLVDSAWNGRSRLRMGAHYLWVDATGDLRIKDGAPTSDLDGTIVGVQA